MNQQELLIDGNLRTVKHWKQKVFEQNQTDFSNQEMDQLEALKEHYREMIRKDKLINNPQKKLREVVEIHQKIKKGDH